MIEQRLGKSCMGVIPYLGNLSLDEEDSVGFDRRDQAPWTERLAPARKLRIGVIAFPSISNFTDFDPLSAEPSVALKYLRDPGSIPLADIIILPGSKQTADDLDWLRERGFEPALNQHARKGRTDRRHLRGLSDAGQRDFRPAWNGARGKRVGARPAPCAHDHGARQGHRSRARNARRRHRYSVKRPIRTSFAATRFTWAQRNTLTEPSRLPSLRGKAMRRIAVPDGCVSADGRIFGSYLHGLFDHDSFRHEFLRCSRAALQMSAPGELVAWSERRRQQLDLLADAFGSALDLDAIFRVTGLPRRAGCKTLAQAQSV